MGDRHVDLVEAQRAFAEQAAEAATLTLGLPGKLALPVRPPDGRGEALGFEPPLGGSPAPVTKIAEGRMTRTTALDLLIAHRDSLPSRTR
ncbi:MAG: hypothetical protein ACHQAY_21230 [Hyphomicrobiales bacterium]